MVFLVLEFVLNGLFFEEELKFWVFVLRMVELVFNLGRNGWIKDMIENFLCLVWRYCILCEESSMELMYVL